VGLFRKDPIKKFLQGRDERRTYLVCNAEVYGTCLLAATPSAFGLIHDNYINQHGKFYFMPDGSIHIWSKESFDEFQGKLKVWGYGFGNNYSESICLRLDLIGFTFVIEEESHGDSLAWLRKNFKSAEIDNLDIF